MSQDTTRFDSTVSAINNSDSGTIHLPAQVQREEGICIDDVVEVRLTDIDADPFVDAVSFEGRQLAGDCITVPAELMRRVGFDGGESVTAEFTVVDDDADEAEAEAESEESDAQDEWGDAEAESDDSEGLGELFG